MADEKRDPGHTVRDGNDAVVNSLRDMSVSMQVSETSYKQLMQIVLTQRATVHAQAKRIAALEEAVKQMRKWVLEGDDWYTRLRKRMHNRHEWSMRTGDRIVKHITDENYSVALMLAATFKDGLIDKKSGFISGETKGLADEIRDRDHAIAIRDTCIENLLKEVDIHD